MIRYTVNTWVIGLKAIKLMKVFAPIITVFLGTGIVLSGCNSASSSGAASNIDDNTSSADDGLCDFGSHDQASANGAHGFIIKLPASECIGQDFQNQSRKTLPVTVETSIPGLTISGQVKVFGGRQPTYSFTLMNSSNIDYCFIKFELVSLLDDIGNELYTKEQDYLDGEVYSNGTITTNTCISSGESIQFGEYLSFETIAEFDQVESIYISNISGVQRDYTKGGPIGFVEFEWSSLEAVTLKNQTQVSMDLSDTYSEINYYDSEGYLIASLFLELPDSAGVTGPGEQFTLYSEEQWDYLKAQTVRVAIDWKPVNTIKNYEFKDRSYYELPDIKRISLEQEAQLHSLSYSQ